MPEVCNPFEGEKVLTTNQTVGYFLPCKIVVYNDNGKTKIGMSKPTMLMEMIEDERLTQTASEIEDRLMSFIVKRK